MVKKALVASLFLTSMVVICDPAVAQFDDGSRSVLENFCVPNPTCAPFGNTFLNSAHQLVWQVQDHNPSTGQVTFAGNVRYSVGSTAVATATPPKANKSGWKSAETLTGIAGNALAVAGAVVGAVEVAPLTVITAFIALGLIAVAPEVLSGVGVSGKVVALVAGIKATIVDFVASAAGITGALKAGFYLSLLGIALGGLNLLAAIQARDPPDPNFTDVPALGANKFDPQSPDGALDNALVSVLDASAVNIESMERYQGAMLAQSEMYAQDQLEAFRTSNFALAQGLATLRDDTDSIAGQLNQTSISPTTNEVAAAEDLFLNTSLPSDLAVALQGAGISEMTFKQLAVDHFDNYTAAPSIPDADASGTSAFGNVGVLAAFGIAATPKIPTTTIPEPSSLTLLGIALIALSATRRRIASRAAGFTRWSPSSYQSAL